MHMYAATDAIEVCGGKFQVGTPHEISFKTKGLQISSLEHDVTLRHAPTSYIGIELGQAIEHKDTA